MKKILIFISFIFIFLLSFTIKLNAQGVTILPKTTIEVGVGNDEYLVEENLERVSGVVDWKKEGNYTIYYRDYSQNIYEKTYTIIPKNNNQYFINKYKENKIDVQLYNEVVDIFYINEHSFYLVSNYQVPDPNLQDQEKINITYYENYEYRWEYRYNKTSRYISGQLYNDNLVITGTVYNESNYVNTIVIFEITKDRALIKSREIKSDKSCYCHGFNVDNDYVYLIASTSGNQYDFEKIKSDNKNRIVLLKLSYKNFQIIDGVVEESVDDFIIQGVSFYERRITFNVSFKINVDYYTNCIYEYNDLLMFVDKYYFSLLNIDYLGYQVTGSELCFYGINHSKNSNCVYIQYLQDEVENKYLILDLQNQYSINQVKIINVSDNDIYFSIRNKKGKEYINLGYCKVNSYNGIIYLNHTPEFIQLTSSKVYNNKLINTYYKDGILYTREIQLIEISLIDYSFNYYSGTRKELFVNCERIYRNRYNITSDLTKYGKYKDVYQFIDYNENEYFLEEEVDVHLQINIDNDETYQKGYKLTFNGEGILNGNIIESDYIINDIGKYQLVIRGNEKEKILNFSVADMTINEIERTTIDVEINSITKYTKLYEDKSFENITYNFINSSHNDFIIPLSIIIFTIGIVLFVCVRKKI